MKLSRGFTVIEIIIVAGLFAAASIIFFIQKNQVDVATRDQERKTSINAMYFSLEEVYYAKHESYPRNLTTDVLYSVDPALFSDPDGVKLGDEGSTLKYEPLNCIEDNCKSYNLKADLEHEDQYTKHSRHEDGYFYSLLLD